MSPAIKILLGVTAIGVVGGVVFFATREAKAQEAASKAFKVSPDCKTIEVIDMAEAKLAVEAAAVASFRGTGELARDFIDRAFGILTRDFPQCPKPLPGETIIKVQGQMPMPIAAVRAVIGDRTLDELKTMVESGDISIGGFNLEGSSGRGQSFRDMILQAAVGAVQ